MIDRYRVIVCVIVFVCLAELVAVGLVGVEMK